jgi:hypothetical protein
MSRQTLLLAVHQFLVVAGSDRHILAQDSLAAEP